MIYFDNVSKVYSGNSIALQGVTFSIEPKEFVSLVGQSGAGKSTLIRLLLAEEKPSSGKVFFESLDVHKLSRKEIPFVRRKIGTVFQDFKLLTDRNVFENVAFALRVAGYSNKKIKHRVYEVLTMTGISHKAKNFPHQLSGGEQQRVSIARAMANEPYIILADEPTGNLDPQNSHEIIKIFQAIHTAGTAVLMATHDAGLINSLPFRRIMLNRGSLVNRDYI